MLGSTESKITKYENSENVLRLQNIEVVLIHFNVANNGYQQNSKVLYIFVPNKSFCQLSDTSSENFIFLKTLTQNFHMLTYCLLIKILNCLR